jgi:GntR family uxuAB operon transcriptional repressor
VALVAQRASEEQLREVEELLERAEELTERVEDLGGFVSAGLQFHASLVRMCGNAHLAAFLDALVDLEEHPLWTLLNAHAMQDLAARRGQIEEHRQILTAIRAGDAERASALMTEHLGHLAQTVEALGDNGSE